MSPAVVLSDRGSGTTTFLGLLYAALVRWGSSGHDGFRVHASHDSIRAIKDVYGSLMDGHFPSHGLEYGRDDLSFVLGYDRVHKVLHGHRPSGRSLSVHVASVEELSELRGRAVVMDDWLRVRLSSQVALVVLDATRLPVDPKSLLSLPHHAFRRYDAAVASCLSLLETYLRADRARQRALLQPIFVLTKADLISPELRAQLGGPPPPLSAGPARRTRWVEEAISERMPQTHGLLAGDGSGIRFAAPMLFVSSVLTEPSPSGEVRIHRRLRLPEGGYEPDYPYEEFAALIAHLQRFAGPAELELEAV